MGDWVRARLATELEERGLPPQLGVYVGEPTPDAPRPPDGPWLIVYHDGRFHVGASARGQFLTYDVRLEGEEAIALVVELLERPAPSKPLEYDADECLKRGLWTAAKILGRTDDRDGEAGPAVLQPGDLLDAMEPETAHHLYPLGTPFEQRSLPPSFAGGPFFAYEVVRSFDGDHPGVLEGRVAPWFEQPGGGAQVVLDRPLRFYLDTGYLVRLDEQDV